VAEAVVDELELVQVHQRHGGLVRSAWRSA
jgi:hypothetical protein